MGPNAVGPSQMQSGGLQQPLQTIGGMQAGVGVGIQHQQAVTGAGMQPSGPQNRLGQPVGGMMGATNQQNQLGNQQSNQMIGSNQMVGQNQIGQQPNQMQRGPQPQPRAINQQQQQQLQQKKPRYFLAMFDYDPSTMSPNPDGCEEELAFQEGDQIKVGADC